MHRRRRLLVVEAAGWLAVARLSLLLLPFRLVAWLWLGPAMAPSALPSSSPTDLERIDQVARAVRRAVRRLPFEAVCLPQAMAARAMLRRRGIAAQVHFGVRGGVVDRFEAHAWLDAAGQQVTGYPLAEDYVELATFR